MDKEVERMLNHPAWQATGVKDNYRQELAMVEIQQTGKDKDKSQEENIEREEFKSHLFD